MEKFIANLPMYLEQISLYLGVLVMVATALVRLPFLSKHEGKVNSVVAFIQKVLKYLPTLGKNPGTAALEKKVASGNAKKN